MITRIGFFVEKNRYQLLVAMIVGVCVLFISLTGAFALLCAVASYSLLAHTYQDKLSMGWTFYAFLCIGLSSTVFVQILFYVPLLWMLMLIQLSALSWRTFAASVLGLLTPYWLLLPVALGEYAGEAFTLEALGRHIAGLADLQFPYDYRQVTMAQLLCYVLIIAMAVTGTIQYWRSCSADKFRIRRFFGCLIVTAVFTAVFIFLQPQHYDILMRLLIICTLPLITLALLNLWKPSLRF